MNLSVVILTKNNQDALPVTVKSLKFAGEILVVDDYSSDETIATARKLKAKVYLRHLNNNFGAQRNFGLEKARGKWVMFIDSDEIVSEELALEIQKKIGVNKYASYYLTRQDEWQGRQIKFGENGRSRLLRLAKRGSGRWKRKVHEIWQVNGKKGYLKGILFHKNKKNIRDYINAINVYSKIHARENIIEGKRINLLGIIFYPTFKFFHNFVLKLSFLDGMHGFVLSCLMSFHSFLSWSTIWLKKNHKS